MIRLHHLTIAWGLLGALLVALAAAAPEGSQDRPRTFKVQTADSSAIFKIRHLGLGHIYGRFNHVHGAYTWDQADPPNGSFRILISADSVDTNDAARDALFKTERFLHAAEFRTITFTSKSIRNLHGSVFRIGGDLTLRGVRKPVTAEVEWFGARETELHGYRSGFEARLTVNGRDFDLPGSAEAGEYGDDVTLIVAVEGVSK